MGIFYFHRVTRLVYASKLKCLFIAVLTFFPGFIFSQSFTVSGYIREKGSGEMLGGVSVGTDVEKTSSNNYGFYTFEIAAGKRSTIYFQAPGFVIDSLVVQGEKDVAYNVELAVIEKIGLVEISVRKSTIADKAEMSKIDIPVQQIKDIPALLGEKDVLKVIQLLPGVQKGGEGQSGIYVRGGGPDQNLIILDEATVYNANHLFGFFSLFNGDALRSVELVKGGFPARYGGRLSSVIEMNMKEGNLNKYSGEFGIGLISSRGLIEGPIKKNKSSFMISGRRTYADILAQPLIMAATNGSNAGYYFYDLNAKANYIISDKDKIYISGYFGRDKFYFADKQNGQSLKTNFGWGNRTLTTRWNHQFNKRTFANLSAIYSHYDLNIEVNIKERNSPEFLLKYQSIIDDYGLKYDIDWSPNNKHKVRYGLSAINHQFQPSATVLKLGPNSPVNRKSEIINTFENGIYIEDQIKYGRWNLYPGVRISHYHVEGKNWVKPETRFSAGYQIRKDLAIKTSAATMWQYIHLLSNTGLGLPTDLWIPATPKVGPMKSEQVALGIAKDYNKGFSVSLEGYYKVLSDIITYKEGASFILQNDFFDPSVPVNKKAWESQVTSGRGWSKGMELFLQKKVGRLSGWVGYTLSWTELQFDSVNAGRKYYAKYDRRHDVSIVGIYKLSKNLTISATWVYGSGNAITLPQAIVPVNGMWPTQYPMVWDVWGSGGNQTLDYGARNSFRMEPYHRLDVGLQFSRDKRRGRETIEVSCYNAYNRANPFFYYGGNSPDFNSRVLKKVTLFPIIPTVTYSFKFSK